MHIFIIECDQGNGFAIIEAFIGTDRIKVGIKANQRCDELRNQDPDYNYNVVCVRKIHEV